MKKFFLSITAIVAMAVTLSSCGGGSTPKATADKFLNGLYHMDYDAAKSVATKETKDQLDMQKQTLDMMGADAMKKAKDEAGKVTVSMKDPVVTGDNATVEYTLSNDQTHAPKTLKMVKQNGAWLASWSKMDGMGDMNGGGANGGQQGAGAPSSMDTSMAPPADGTSNMTPADTTKH